VKLQLAGRSALNTVTAYGEGYVMINGERHEGNLIVLPERILSWGAAGFEALGESDFEMLAGLGTELVLLGTGASLRFPAPRLTQALALARIGLEVMDTQAACRTYNILMAEERRVAAALLLR
jgi:uncharacterized protein